MILVLEDNKNVLVSLHVTPQRRQSHTKNRILQICAENMLIFKFPQYSMNMPFMGFS